MAFTMSYDEPPPKRVKALAEADASVKAVTTRQARPRARGMTAQSAAGEEPSLPPDAIELPTPTPKSSAP